MDIPNKWSGVSANSESASPGPSYVQQRKHSAISVSEGQELFHPPVRTGPSAVANPDHATPMPSHFVGLFSRTVQPSQVQ
jgi:hypothetical protein